MINIKEIKTPEEYESFLKNEDKLLIVKFSADWCSPCRLLGERIQAMDETKLVNVLIGEINVEDEIMESVVSKCGIRGIPVLIFYKDGNEVERHVGLTDAKYIYKILENIKD